MQKVMSAMSGGVDSSVATALLMEKNYDTVGATLRLFDNHGKDPLGDANDAKAVCEKLGIQHFVFDLRQEFKKRVVSDFINEYYNGATPNPCIQCNKTIKFGALLEKALELNQDFIATGHYAVIKKDSGSGRYLVSRPLDRTKDQTYVLYGLNQHQLSHTLTPLGSLTKTQVREIAAAYGFVNANRADSQDICFVPNGDYAEFIEEYTGKAYPCGDYIDELGNVIGKHKGVIRYTIGQRKGLGVAFGKPQFVLSKDAVNNTVTLGDEDKLFYNRVVVKNTNFIPFESLNAPLKVKAKLRYRQTEQSAVIHPLDSDTVLIEFEAPQRAPSLGQAAVFYDGDTVVGGGTIVQGE